MVDDKRPSASGRLYGRRWQRESKAYLASHRLCVHCQRRGKARIATIVDHVIPHRGDFDLFWDVNNWQPLCKPHHDRKTATEDGGFGH